MKYFCISILIASSLLVFIGMEAIEVGGANETMIVKTTKTVDVNPDEIFSIAMIPDTQHMIRNNAAKSDDLFQYVVDQKEAKNLKFMFHMGDVVSAFGVANNQWDTADISFDIWKASGIPFLSNIGNHDFDQNMGTSRTATEFNDLIDLTWLQAQPWFVGNHEGVANTAAKITVGKYTYLFTSTEHVPRQASTDWTTGIIDANPTDHIIAGVHSLLLANNTRATDSDLVYYWDEMSAYDNLRLTMNGHVYGAGGAGDPAKAHRTDDGVTQMCLNYQNESGNNYEDSAVVRFITIDQSDHSASVTTFNAITGIEYTDSDNKFTFNF